MLITFLLGYANIVIILNLANGRGFYNNDISLDTIMNFKIKIPK